MATHSSFLPGESQGWGILVGCHLWGRTESDTTEATYEQQQYALVGDSYIYLCKKHSYIENEEMWTDIIYIPIQSIFQTPEEYLKN